MKARPGWGRGSKKPERDKYLTPAGVRRLVAAANAVDREAALAFRLAYFFGLRCGEVADLKAGDIDLDHGQLWVRTLKRGGGAKRGPGRPRRKIPYYLREDRPVFPVPIPRNAEARRTVEDAKHRAAGSPGFYVFPGRIAGRPRTTAWFRDVFRRCARRARLSPGASFHSLRHSYGTLVAAATKDPIAVRNYLRHSNLETTSRYMHLAHDYADEIGRFLRLDSGEGEA